MLYTLGGDGETALRLVRQAQSRCRELTVIVPDQAKSAGTLFVLGSDHIVMGPTSDLGPNRSAVSVGKRILGFGKGDHCRRGGRRATCSGKPANLPAACVLAERHYGPSRPAGEGRNRRTDDLLAEALACADGRDENRVAELAATLREPLIESAQSHGATIPARYALELGLPVEEPPVSGAQWRSIWRPVGEVFRPSLAVRL